MRPFLLALALLAVSAAPAFAQPTDRVLRFLDPSGDLEVSAEVIWGDVHVVGHDGDEIRLRVTHTAEDGEPRRVADIADYVEVMATNTRYRIRARQPRDGAFESIDLTVMVPARADLTVGVARGGEIRVEGIDGVVSVNHRNGSVDLRRLGGPALVNAVNGSIRASFRRAPTGAMSFMTLNGEVELFLPPTTRAAVRLRSERNGYIDSDFVLPGVDYPYDQEAGASAAKPRHSARPIDLRSTLNGGGPSIDVRTENGPIKLRATR